MVVYTMSARSLFSGRATLGWAPLRGCGVIDGYDETTGTRLLNLCTVDGDAIGGIVSDGRLLAGHRVKFMIGSARCSASITIGEKNYATASINDARLVLSDSVALCDLLSTGTWSAAQHGAVKRMQCVRGLALLQIPRLGKLSYSRSPSLHGSRCAVMNTPASMRSIMAFATPYCTPTDAEETSARAASSGNDAAVFEASLRSGIDPNLLLCSACEGGTRAFVEELILCGADPDGLDTILTPLFLATRYDHIDTMHCLIDAGADPSKLSGNGVPPIMYAAIVGNLPALNVLVAAGADIDAHETTKGATPLIVAIDSKRVSIVNRLIDIGADVNARMLCGKTALIGASRLALDVVIERLIANGADVHAVTNGTMVGATGLVYAAGAGYRSTVELLIESGADVNARCADGSTALFWACHRGHVPVVSMLLDKGADKHLTGLMGLTPSRIPIVSNRAAIIGLLRSHLQ